MTAWRQGEGGVGCVYSYTHRQRRGKADWAGVGMGDAFKTHLEYHRRLPAQRLFYQAVAKAQRTVARHLDAEPEDSFQPRVRPQLGPCYTNYPAHLAAYACIGLTAYLELRARVSHPLLQAQMEQYLEGPAQHDQVEADPESYARLARFVVETVQQRLLLEDVYRLGRLPTVEVYRLFGCAQQDLKFASLEDVVRAVVLFGDVMPAWDLLPLHPATRRMLKELDELSRDYRQVVASSDVTHLLREGEGWARAICRALAQYLPPPPEEQDPQERGEARRRDGVLARFLGLGRSGGDAPAQTNPALAGQALAPLDGPAPPTLERPQNAGQLALQALMGARDPQESPPAATLEILTDFARVMQSAGGQHKDWEDMRSDLVEALMETEAFQEGPISGSPTEGNEVALTLGGKQTNAKEIFDRAVELSHDQAALDLLLDQARPVAERLRRDLYPNIEQSPQSLRLRVSGALDGGRLPLAQFSPAVFRRFRNVERADRRGRPLLVIACDGSGSLEPNQMRMLKVLAAAWLVSTAGSEVQVMAALYHSGRVREGLAGPLVQWIYHPRKTPAWGRSEAVRALVSLPDIGTGAQSDALSLAFIMNEARRLAKGNMVYLTLLSDTQWNRSFGGEMSGGEEVRAFFTDLRHEMGVKLHTLLVALGESGATGLEGVLDKVIPVADKDLDDPAAVAEQIGLYVAARLRRHHGSSPM